MTSSPARDEAADRARPATTGGPPASACRADASSGEHVWMQVMPWWHVGFAATLAGVFAWSVLQLHGDAPRMAAVVSLYAALAALYFLLMSGRLGRLWPGRDNLVYLAGAFAVFGAAGFLFPGTAVLLVILIPHCFMFLDLRPACAAVLGLVAINAGATFDAEGFSPGTVTSVVIYGTVTAALALLLGGYISRIIEQSRHRAALIDELERTRAELAALNREAGARAEQERLGREIHDALAQGFTSVLMLIQAARASIDRGDLDAARRQLALAEPAAREGLAEARSLISSLAPLHLQSASLPAALARVCSDLGERFGYTARLHIEGEAIPLSQNAQIVLLRAAQEALANVGRHAHASSATVTLTFGTAAVELVVADDGIGFETESRTGFGLAQLRSRTEEMGGRADVCSCPDGGTTIRVLVPAETSNQDPLSDLVRNPGSPAPEGDRPVGPRW